MWKERNGCLVFVVILYQICYVCVWEGNTFEGMFHGVIVTRNPPPLLHL